MSLDTCHSTHFSDHVPQRTPRRHACPSPLLVRQSETIVSIGFDVHRQPIPVAADGATPHSGLWTPDSGPRAPDSGPRTQDSGFRTLDSGLRTPDSGLRT